MPRESLRVHPGDQWGERASSRAEVATASLTSHLTETTALLVKEQLHKGPSRRWPFPSALFFSVAICTSINPAPSSPTQERHLCQRSSFTTSRPSEPGVQAASLVGRAPLQKSSSFTLLEWSQLLERKTKCLTYACHGSTQL